jgi:hypothetical protein
MSALAIAARSFPTEDRSQAASFLRMSNEYSNSPKYHGRQKKGRGTNGIVRSLDSIPLEASMRVLVAIGIAYLTLSPVLASQAVSRDDAEAMRVEALGDRAPEKVLGNAPYVMEEPIAPVDLTTGQNTNEPEECASVHVKTTLSNGTKVSKRINMCD